MTHPIIKIAFIVSYACLLGYAAYKILMGYVERHNITERRNPMFADLLRGLIAMGTGVDIALAAWLIAEVVK